MSETSITLLLEQWSGGDERAFPQLVPLVYDQLRRIARNHLAKERPGHTLQPTELVHELWLRLARQSAKRWANRTQFFRVASRLMRLILVDYAKARTSAKRGGGKAHDDADLAAAIPQQLCTEWLMVDQALGRFAATDPRRAEVVEMRYFGGLSLEEIAELREVSLATIKRDWTVARMWLQRSLSAPAATA